MAKNRENVLIGEKKLAPLGQGFWVAGVALWAFTADLIPELQKEAARRLQQEKVVAWIGGKSGYYHQNNKLAARATFAAIAGAQLDNGSGISTVLEMLHRHLPTNIINYIEDREGNSITGSWEWLYEQAQTRPNVIWEAHIGETNIYGTGSSQKIARLDAIFKFYFRSG